MISHESHPLWYLWPAVKQCPLQPHLPFWEDTGSGVHIAGSELNAVTHDRFFWSDADGVDTTPLFGRTGPAMLLGPSGLSLPSDNQDSLSNIFAESL